MLQQNMQQIVDIEPQEEEFFASVAGRCGDGFCSKAMTNIEKVTAMIDRNVNSKILFCDLVNRMFISI